LDFQITRKINRKGGVSLDVSEDIVLQATSIFDIEHIVLSFYGGCKGRKGSYLDALERGSFYRRILKEVLNTVGSVLGSSLCEGPTEHKQPMHVMTETEFPKHWIQKLTFL
jgi:hypothetical protein